MTTMGPCPKCHPTERPHIETIDGHPTATRSVKAGCTERHASAQIDYVPTGPFADGRGPDGVQSTCGGIERWNGHRDDREGIFSHGRENMRHRAIGDGMAVPAMRPRRDGDGD